MEDQIRHGIVTYSTADPVTLPPGEVLVKDPKTGAMKGDGTKLRYDLFPPRALADITNILTYGGNKYGDNNWRKGLDWSRVFSASMRHLWAWWGGEDRDPETGYSHLAHAACNLVFLIEYEYSNRDKDNRFDKVTNE
jgi:hypothetical protein